MKLITLTRGMSAMVDDADYEQLSAHKWHAYKARNTYYAGRTGSGATRPTIQMHRVILSAPAGMQIDHIDGDGLNNQRHNLRLANYSQNGANRRKDKDNTSGYKGVTWNVRRKKWQSKLRVNGTRHYLGFFHDPAEAARAYDAAATRYHGEYARTNFGSGQI